MRNAAYLFLAVTLLVAGCVTPQKSAEVRELEKKHEEMVRLESQIDKNLAATVDRKRFVSGQRAGLFQSYVSFCLARIVEVGSVNYPSEARGKIYGKVTATFSVRADGGLEGVEVDKSSGHLVLDKALVSAIRLSAPFKSFPPDFPPSVEVLSVTQTFHYVADDLGSRIEF